MPRVIGRRAIGLAIALGAVIGCGSGKDDGATGGSGDDAGAEEPKTFGGSRPVKVRVPAGYDPAVSAPLVVLLHGYSASGFVQDLIFHVSSIADQEGYFFAAPDGTVDSQGNRFWNATDGCCNLDGSPVDDVAYLTGLVHEIEAAYAIDPKRVYFVGHSNGGFMSHRLACDAAKDVAAIVSYAGAVWDDATRCNPSEPVAVLEIHGDADTDVLYAGDPSPTHPYPGAVQTVATWADKNHCAGALDGNVPAIDLDSSLAGAETQPARYGGCAPGGAAELWTVQGGGHIPNPGPQFPEQLWAFMKAHPKP